MDNCAIVNDFGVRIVDNFGFTIGDSKREFDALIVKCPGESDCHTPQFDVPLHTREEYIQYIQSRQLEKATVILKDISWLPQCPSLKDLVIIPSEQAAGNFDFSPLYEMPEVRSLECRNQYGQWDQYLNEIDYSRVPGLVNLVLEDNKGAKKVSKCRTLKPALYHTVPQSQPGCNTAFFQQGTYVFEFIYEQYPVDKRRGKSAGAAVP